MKRDFKTGEKVWHPEFGWGRVQEATLTSPNCWVDFGERTIWCGWWELFYDEVELPNPPKPEPEIDWTKVPPWTKVLVSAKDGVEMEKLFLVYDEEGVPFHFWAFDPEFGASATPWEYCRIHPDVEIKEEWLKK